MTIGAAATVLPNDLSSERRPAIFLDRDGTIIEHVHYLSRPEEVRLLPESARALRLLSSAGYVLVLVTNQAAIAKGIITHEDLREIHTELERQFAIAGVVLDAIYYSPLASIGNDPTKVEFPDRKPGAGMLLRAAQELHLDLARSWMVGDAISDVLAGHNAQCRCCVLIRSPGNPPAASLDVGVNYRIVTNLLEAAELILHEDGTRPSPKCDTVP
jgi:D-glycero-D-manno-heptose 1,7-bisphosphate phosphatase